jgi:molybdenum cofactor biosynthesis protein A
MKKLKDQFGRIHDYVRISLIDKCNLNCVYCNPVGSKVNYLRKNEMMSPGAIVRLCSILVKNFGVKKIRFTGGEPLIRKDIHEILRKIGELKSGFEFKTGITTNGTHLNENLQPLKDSGLNHLNISLDTLLKTKFDYITGKDLYDNTLNAISKALETGFDSVKLNVVIMKGINEDELTDFIDYYSDSNINIRFIEYMPFSQNNWSEGKFISYEDMKEFIQRKYKLTKIDNGSIIAKDYELIGSSCTVSFISTLSSHFCDKCNRLRFTADGKIKLCLFSESIDAGLKEMLDTGEITDDEIADVIASVLWRKEEKHPGVEELVKLDTNNMLSIGG